MTFDFGRIDPAELALLTQGGSSRDHIVEIYQDDSTLVGSVSRFLAAGLEAGEATLVIATPEHRAAFEGALAQTINLKTAQEAELYVALDARETVSLFMDEGSPDRVRFERVIGDMIGRAAANNRKVRAFGEMVALLWADGNVAGALALEELWNKLAETYPFTLFCAYPLDYFGDKNLAPLRAVCNTHTHVRLPS